MENKKGNVKDFERQTRGHFVFTVQEQLESMGLGDATAMLRVYQVSICLESDGCLSSGTLWWMSAVKPFSNKMFPCCRPLFSQRTNLRVIESLSIHIGAAQWGVVVFGAELLSVMTKIHSP